jgi:5-methylcytosine-specific restriction endonuclease McrA
MRKGNLFLAAEREYKHRNTEKGFLSLRIKDIFKPSAIKSRGFVPNCTKAEIKKYFYEYVEKHGRNCFYCKKPWTYITNRYVVGNGLNHISDKGKSRKNKLKNFSIDRLNSSETYSIDNIIFCCTECNLSKKNISFKLIKRLYKIITERNL